MSESPSDLARTYMRLVLDDDERRHAFLREHGYMLCAALLKLDAGHADAIHNAAIENAAQVVDVCDKHGVAASGDVVRALKRPAETAR